ncbi:30S ribosome-binding factor RbfA [Lacticaseibacillus zhaodongensis]|uniref:30S ribosome-binding factor RbfA n=1 Tax=Lacticaseibacillus zhaodongensis TaxID=2668065 RepID=UPI0012D325A4|nr:30S ribosome-binding factor RbfA [Lacticaseibacillus zhaodongensis]
MKHRIGRVETQIQREVDDILLKLVNDHRVNGVTITGVELTGDLQQATVYYSTLQDDEKTKAQAQEGLDKATGLIRREVGKRIRLFKVPTMTFARDESVEYGAKIDRLIAEARKIDDMTPKNDSED